jgi:hypothetical protein
LEGTSKVTNHDSHPDLAELDALRTGEASPETARHVEECPKCRAALDDITLVAGEVAKAAAAPVIDIPEAIDQRMRMLARTRAAEVRSGTDRAESRRRIFTPLRALAGVAAAAAVIVAAGVFTMTGTPAPERTAPMATTLADTDAMDIDSSGTVDIVDAYLMSRRMKRGGAQPSWDFDDDGAVTDRDVLAVARKAVALGDAEGDI